MGTRCLVMLWDNETHIFLYRHSNGRPEDRFPKLLEFNKICNQKRFFQDSMKIGRLFVLEDRWQPISHIPWDIEYLYLVDVSKDPWNIYVVQYKVIKYAYENNQAFLTKITS